jgi:hypothetical protein
MQNNEGVCVVGGQAGNLNFELVLILCLCFLERSQIFQFIRESEFQLVFSHHSQSQIFILNKI